MNTTEGEWYLIKTTGNGISRTMITAGKASRILEEIKNGKHKNCKVIKMDSMQGYIALKRVEGFL